MHRNRHGLRRELGATASKDAISRVTENVARDDRMMQPAEWLDRYDTYHLRMWLISDPTDNDCCAQGVSSSMAAAGCRCTAHPGDCGADATRVSPSRSTKAHGWCGRGIHMTSTDELLNADASVAGEQGSAHEEPSRNSFALFQIRTAQPPPRYERCAVAFSREVPVNAA